MTDRTVAILRIAAAAALLCWMAPDAPRAVLGLASGVAARAAAEAAGNAAGEAVRAAGGAAAREAVKAAGETLLPLCAEEPARCIALAASAVALARPSEPKASARAKIRP